MSWRPSYKNVVHQLSTPLLYAEILKLENSIKHLKRSNDELKLHADNEDEGQWTLDVVKENEDVIAKQEEQIEMVKGEIIERGQTGHGDMDVQGNDKLHEGVNGNGVHEDEATGEDMDLDEEDGVHL
jgi:vacuolar-type H+-ATPase subunit H